MGSKGANKGKSRPIHIPCRRCGKTAYHKIKGVCSSCGYGNSSKVRKYNWNKK